MKKAVAIRIVSTLLIPLWVAGSVALATAAIGWIAVAAGAKWWYPIPLLPVFIGVFLVMFAIMLIPSRYYYHWGQGMWRMSRRESFKKLRRTNGRFGFLFSNPLHILIWGTWMAFLLVLEERFHSLVQILWAFPGTSTVMLGAEAILVSFAPYIILTAVAVWQGRRTPVRIVRCLVCASLGIDTPAQTRKFFLLRASVRTKWARNCTFHEWKAEGDDTLEEYILSVSGNYYISLPKNYQALAVVD